MRLKRLHCTAGLMVMILHVSYNLFAQTFNKEAAKHTAYLGMGGKHFTYGIGYNKCVYLVALPLSFAFDVSFFAHNESYENLRGLPLSFQIAYGKTLRAGLAISIVPTLEGDKEFGIRNEDYEADVWTHPIPSPFLKFQKSNGGLYASIEIIPFINQTCENIPQHQKPFSHFCKHIGDKRTFFYPGIEVGYTFPRRNRK